MDALVGGGEVGIRVVGGEVGMPVVGGEVGMRVVGGAPAAVGEWVVGGGVGGRVGGQLGGAWAVRSVGLSIEALALRQWFRRHSRSTSWRL